MDGQSRRELPNPKVKLTTTPALVLPDTDKDLSSTMTPLCKAWAVC